MDFYNISCYFLVPISNARTLSKYPSREEGVLSFQTNEIVTVYSKPQDKSNNLWGVEINGKRGFVPGSLIRETKITKKREALLNVELDGVAKVPLKSETVENATPDAKIDPNSVKKDYEVVDGTTLYVDDVITPSATQESIEATATNDFKSSVETEPLALKIGSSNVDDKAEADKSVNNEGLEPTGSFLGDVMNSISNLMNNEASEENDDDNEDDEDDDEEDEEEESVEDDEIDLSAEKEPETFPKEIQQTVGENKLESENTGDTVKEEQTVAEVTEDKTYKEGENVAEATKIKTEDSGLKIRAANLEIDSPHKTDGKDLGKAEDNLSNSAEELVQNDEPQNTTETVSSLNENEAEKNLTEAPEILSPAENTILTEKANVITDDIKSDENTINIDVLPKEISVSSNLESTKDDILSEANTPPIESNAAKSQESEVAIKTEHPVSEENPLLLETTETQAPLPESVNDNKIDAPETPPLEIPLIPKDVGENIAGDEQPQNVLQQENVFENSQEFSEQRVLENSSENISELPKETTEEIVDFENKKSIADEQATLVQNSAEASTESRPSNGLFSGLYSNVFAEETVTEKAVNDEILITEEQPKSAQNPEEILKESGGPSSGLFSGIYSPSVSAEEVATEKIINHGNENVVINEESKLVESSEEAAKEDGSSNGFLGGIYSSMFGGQGVDQKQDVSEGASAVIDNEVQRQEEVASSPLTAKNSVDGGIVSDEIPPMNNGGKC